MQLQTERLTIRPMTDGDWPAVMRIADDFRAGPYVYYDHPMPADEAGIQKVVQFFSSSSAVYSVLLSGTSDMIGYVCLWPDESSMDLGYCFHSAYHGHGYGFEACTALMEHMHSHLGTSRFTCGTALDNVPSRRLLNKLGFVPVEESTISFHKDSAGNDIVFRAGSFEKEYA